MATTQDTIQDATQDEDKLIQFCTVARSRQEMMDFMGLVNRKHFIERYLKPLLSSGKLAMTIPDKPSSKHQKYIAKK